MSEREALRDLVGLIDTAGDLYDAKQLRWLKEQPSFVNARAALAEKPAEPEQRADWSKWDNFVRENVEAKRLDVITSMFCSLERTVVSPAERPQLSAEQVKEALRGDWSYQSLTKKLNAALLTGVAEKVPPLVDRHGLFTSPDFPCPYCGKAVYISRTGGGKGSASARSVHVFHSATDNSHCYAPTTSSAAPAPEQWTCTCAEGKDGQPIMDKDCMVHAPDPAGAYLPPAAPPVLQASQLQKALLELVIASEIFDESLMSNWNTLARTQLSTATKAARALLVQAGALADSPVSGQQKD